MITALIALAAITLLAAFEAGVWWGTRSAVRYMTGGDK